MLAVVPSLKVSCMLESPVYTVRPMTSGESVLVLSRLVVLVTFWVPRVQPVVGFTVGSMMISMGSGGSGITESAAGAGASVDSGAAAGALSS
jgi:hypothetical protein